MMNDDQVKGLINALVDGNIKQAKKTQQQHMRVLSKTVDVIVCVFDDDDSFAITILKKSLVVLHDELDEMDERAEVMAYKTGGCGELSDGEHDYCNYLISAIRDCNKKITLLEALE